MKKIQIIISLLLCILLCCSCTPYRKYYSKSQVKRLTKKLVSKDIKYVDKEKIDHDRIYFFEDSQGRSFSVCTYSYNYPTYVGSIDFLYETAVVDTYQMSIFQYEKEEIQKVLDDSGLEWSSLGASDDSEYDESEKIKTAKSEFCYWMGLTIANPAKEDLKNIAKTVAQVDQILQYEYQPHVSTLLNYKDQNPSCLDIYLNAEGINRHIWIDFSRSEDKRWTEDSLYDFLLERYAEYESELRALGKIK